jgi:hypothetical protein
LPQNFNCPREEAPRPGLTRYREMAFHQKGTYLEPGELERCPDDENRHLQLRHDSCPF